MCATFSTCGVAPFTFLPCSSLHTPRTTPVPAARHSLTQATGLGFDVRLRGQESGEPWRYRSLAFRGSPSDRSTEDEPVEEAAGGALRLLLHFSQHSAAFRTHAQGERGITPVTTTHLPCASTPGLPGPTLCPCLPTLPAHAGNVHCIKLWRREVPGMWELALHIALAPRRLPSTVSGLGEQGCTDGRAHFFAACASCAVRKSSTSTKSSVRALRPSHMSGGTRALCPSTHHRSHRCTHTSLQVEPSTASHRSRSMIKLFSVKVRRTPPPPAPPAVVPRPVEDQW